MIVASVITYWAEQRGGSIILLTNSLSPPASQMRWCPTCGTWGIFSAGESSCFYPYQTWSPAAVCAAAAVLVAVSSLAISKGKRLPYLPRLAMVSGNFGAGDRLGAGGDLFDGGSLHVYPLGWIVHDAGLVSARRSGKAIRDKNSGDGCCGCVAPELRAVDRATDPVLAKQRDTFPSRAARHERQCCRARKPRESPGGAWPSWRSGQRISSGVANQP